jgi:phage-related protein
MRRIVFYRKESGRAPVEEFLDTLNAKSAQKVVWVLRLIEELNEIPLQYFKKLKGTDNIWEVRIQVGNNIFRILGFMNGTDLVVLNHAFQKKSQKTPLKDIRIAERRKREYLSRQTS